MTYDELLTSADSTELIVREKTLKANKNRLKRKHISIKKDLNNTDKVYISRRT